MSSIPRDSQDAADLIEDHLRANFGDPVRIPGRATFRDIINPVEPIRLYGGELLRKPSALTGVRTFFGGGAPIHLENMQLTVPHDPAVTAFYVFPGGVSDTRLQHTKVDLGVTHPRNWPASLFLLDDKGGSDYELLFCDLQNISYVFMKANESTGHHRGFRVIGSRIDHTSNPPLLFNSPHPDSVLEDILVMGNRVGSNYNQQGMAHRGTFAGQNVFAGRVFGNYMTGEGAEMWRFEEGTHDHALFGNVAVLRGEHGIEVTSNKQGNGVPYTVRHLNIFNNVLDGKNAHGAGLHAVWALTPSLEDSVVQGNLFHDWEIGMSLGNNAHRNLFLGNALVQNKTALRVNHLSLGIKDTLVTDAETVLQTNDNTGGLIGEVHLRSTPQNMVVKESPHAAPAGPDVITRETDELDIPPGISSVPLFPLGPFAYGRFKLSWSKFVHAHRTCLGELTYQDGGLSVKETASYGAGLVFMSLHVENGHLAVRFDNRSSVCEKTRLQFKLDGAALY